MSRASVLALLALGAAAAAVPAFAQAPSADRYGPSADSQSPPSQPPVYQGAAYPMRSAPPSGAPARMRGRTLSWPGKREPAAGAPAYAPPQASAAYLPVGYGRGGYRSPAYAGAAGAARAYPSSVSGARDHAAADGGYSPAVYPGTTPARHAYAGPPPMRQAYVDRTATAPSPPRAYAPAAYTAGAAGPDGWRPVFADAPSRPPTSAPEPSPALAGAPSRPSAPPTSIYTPAPVAEMTPSQRAAAAPPPLRTASAAQRYGYDPSQGHAVRFYSVHRPFGLQPDAAPIPPQFFTATADLSEPAGPLPTDRTTTTTTASGARVSHVAPDTSVN